MGRKSLSVLPASDGEAAAGPGAAPQGKPAPHVKPAVDPVTLRHKDLLRGRFWAHIPAYAEVDEETFLDHKWQSKHTITNVDKLLSAVRGIAAAGEDFLRDAAEGFAKGPMSVRVTPYLLSLIDWSDPYNDPLRIQFIPLSSRLLPDHPQLGLDSLHEMEDAPVPGLTMMGQG